jgi:hypothetical protein
MKLTKRRAEAIESSLEHHLRTQKLQVQYRLATGQRAPSIQSRVDAASDMIKSLDRTLGVRAEEIEIALQANRTRSEKDAEMREIVEELDRIAKSN